MITFAPDIAPCFSFTVGIPWHFGSPFQISEKRAQVSVCTLQIKGVFRLLEACRGITIVIILLCLEDMSAKFVFYDRSCVYHKPHYVSKLRLFMKEF